MSEVSKAAKVERRIPVQSRVDILALASLDSFFSSVGYQAQSISALVSMAIDLLYDKLLEHELIPEGGKFDSVAEANNYLNVRGLRQSSLKRRGDAKIATAIGFENLRNEGVDPKDYAPSMYKQIHNQPRTTDSEDRLKNPGKADITSPKSRGHSSDPRQLSEEELDEKAKYMIRKEQTQRELYEKMSKPVDEESTEDKSDEE